LAFFGIPFVTFAFPEGGEQLATLATAAISPISVAISIAILEIYRLEGSKSRVGLFIVARRLAKNPLILSVFAGAVFSLLRLDIPAPISTSLHMLGGTTSTVAIFLLGVFLYGRKYGNFSKAFGLSLMRIIFLPALAFFTTPWFGLTDMSRSTLVLMHGMPIAISMIVLSERYNFYKELIASTILISSLAAGLYLNIWLVLLGY
ncbi:AEC family transporter, partial [Candidatus Bathyarchaeota archaeon]|nr:AEC family transporter [Candidatus Bathyarchaeota archaeon]